MEKTGHHRHLLYAYIYPPSFSSKKNALYTTLDIGSSVRSSTKRKNRGKAFKNPTVVSKENLSAEMLFYTELPQAWYYLTDGKGKERKTTRAIEGG